MNYEARLTFSFILATEEFRLTQILIAVIIPCVYPQDKEVCCEYLSYPFTSPRPDAAISNLREGTSEAIGGYSQSGLVQQIHPPWLRGNKCYYFGIGLYRGIPWKAKGWEEPCGVKSNNEWYNYQNLIIFRSTNVHIKSKKKKDELKMKRFFFWYAIRNSARNLPPPICPTLSTWYPPQSQTHLAIAPAAGTSNIKERPEYFRTGRAKQIVLSNSPIMSQNSMTSVFLLLTYPHHTLTSDKLRPLLFEFFDFSIKQHHLTVSTSPNPT